jgi:hypothetical protein
MLVAFMPIQALSQSNNRQEIRREPCFDPQGRPILCTDRSPFEPINPNTPIVESPRGKIRRPNNPMIRVKWRSTERVEPGTVRIRTFSNHSNPNDIGCEIVEKTLAECRNPSGWEVGRYQIVVESRYEGSANFRIIEPISTEPSNLQDRISWLENNKLFVELSEYFEQQIQQSPNNLQLFNTLADLYFWDMGLPHKAVEPYKKAVEMGSSTPETYHDLGIALARTGRNNEAIPYLESASSMYSRNEDQDAVKKLIERIRQSVR